MSSLSVQSKKILTIATVAFACLAACYALFLCCSFIAKEVDRDDDKSLPSNLVKKTDVMPLTAEEYIDLGKSLPLDGKIEFPDGTEMTQEEVFLEAIKIDPECAAAYNHLGTIIDAISKVKLHDGSELNQQQLFLNAVEKDPELSSALCNLGSTLEGGGSMELPDGSQLTREQQFVRVIKKHNAVAHPSLTQIAVPGFPTEMTRKELFLKAHELDKDNSTAYYNLRFAIKPGETVILSDGRSANILSLLIITLLLNPQHAEAFSDLANLISQRAPPLRLPIADLPAMTKQGFYLHSCTLDPHDGSLYFNLAHTLNYDGVVMLPNGKSMTPKKLILKAIDIDPYYYGYYSELINLLEPNETIELLDGTTMTQKQLSDKVDDCANRYGMEASPY